MIKTLYRTCPARALLVAEAMAQLGGLGADFGKCTLQRVHGSLLACRPAAYLSDRRPPVILYSAIAGEGKTEATRAK